MLCIACTGCPLEVSSGMNYCQIDPNGCATDGSGNHGNDERCSILVNAAGTLTATSFDTEAGYDHVTLGGTEYSGATGPNRVSVAQNTVFTWVSDGSVTKAGWTICLTPGGEGCFYDHDAFRRALSRCSWWTTLRRSRDSLKRSAAVGSRMLMHTPVRSI